MNMKYCLFLVLVGLCSCGVQQEEIDLSSLSGNWITESEGTIFCEDWGVFSGSGLIGIGYMIEGVDTTFTEKLRIFPENGSWIYEATVFEQNNSESIEFIMTSDSLNIFVFENPLHDFPNKITYNFCTPEEMKVNVGNGNPASEMSVSFRTSR